MSSVLEVPSIIRRGSGSSRSHSDPPSYNSDSGVAVGSYSDESAAAALSDLDISPNPRDPTASYCLVHLKVLYAFESMKEDIGYTDGLWGLWNSRATDGPVHIHAYNEAGQMTEEIKDASTDNEARQTALSQIREKRWALFVARAVDRYEAWWNSMPKDYQLREEDLTTKSTSAYEYFVQERHDELVMTKDELPPLDVLMVWHTHMLNPRAYLQDCMRAGRGRLWHHGMPWDLINEAIDTSFTYSVPDEVKAIWVSKTNRPWENTDDAEVKSLQCPTCSIPTTIPWTTCGAEESDKQASATSLVGQGFGDGDLNFTCHACGGVINRKLLSVAKFCSDSRNLLADGVPMPGTVLRPATGKPEAWVVKPSRRQPSMLDDPMTLPNRLIKKVLYTEIQKLLEPSSNEASRPSPTMEDVRSMIETALKDQKVLRAIVNTGPNAEKVHANLPPVARMSVRKMMSQYWDNSSPFALDLSGAVMRQGVFVSKMYKLDWLHSPVAPKIMDRIYTKYTRFLRMMRFNPDQMFVPTLDVDLAWHTHQLSPLVYYKACTEWGRKFIDHDDKIREDKLGEAFEFTSKAYQDAYGLVYSECTCWYCEAVRFSHVSSVGRVLKLSHNEKVADKFHSSGAADMCPPDKGAHISAHNAVGFHQPTTEEDVKGAVILDTQKKARAAYESRMDSIYTKACERAEKKGRKLPPKEDYYSHWGTNYYMYGPWYPTYFTPTMYNTPPTSVPSNYTGAEGGCVAGTCGGAVTAAGTKRRNKGEGFDEECGGGCGGGCGASCSGGGGGGGGGGKGGGGSGNDNGGSCGGSGGGGCGGGGGGGGGCGGGGGGGC